MTPGSTACCQLPTASDLSMPELILTILRLIFLALIYLFIWQVVRALARHIGYTRSDNTRKMSNRVTVVTIRFPGGTVVSGHDGHGGGQE